VPLAAAFRCGEGLPQYNGPGWPLIDGFNRDGLDDIINSGHLFLMPSPLKSPVCVA
jgi:hypothetical protein